MLEGGKKHASGMKCTLLLHFCVDVSNDVRKMRNIDMRAAWTRILDSTKLVTK